MWAKEAVGRPPFRTLIHAIMNNRIGYVQLASRGPEMIIAYFQRVTGLLQRLTERQRIAAAVAFSLPLWPQLTIALTAVWLVLELPRLPMASIHAVRHAGYRWNVLLFMGLTAGLLWTVHLSAGLKELKDESYLLAFALLFAARPLTATATQSIRNALTTGTLFAITICTCLAFYRFLSTGNPGEFFYTSFSRLLHPTYFGLLLLTVALMTIDAMRKVSFRERKRYDYLLLSAVFLAIGLLCSKIIYLVFVAVAASGFAIGLLRRNLQLFSDRRLQVIGIGALFFFVAVNTYFNRTAQVIDALAEVKTEKPAGVSPGMVDSSVYNSTTVRIAQWKYGLELVKRQAVYGAGTGDEIDDLRTVFREHNDPYALLHFGHAHSHYLHYLVMLGYAGALLALLALVVPLLNAWRRKNHAAVLFFCMLLPVGLTDILSHATMGACYGFLSCLFLASETEEKKEVTPV